MRYRSEPAVGRRIDAIDRFAPVTDGKRRWSIVDGGSDDRPQPDRLHETPVESGASVPN